MHAARGAGVTVPRALPRAVKRQGSRYPLRRRIRLEAYGARLESVLGGNPLTSSNLVSSAVEQHKRRVSPLQTDPTFAS